MPKLYGDISPIVMNRIRHGLKARHGFIPVNSELSRLVPTMGVNIGVPGDDQTHAPPRTIKAAIRGVAGPLENEFR